MDATNATNSATSNCTSATAFDGGDSYDEPYRFGRKPTVRAPFPFTEREFARLLIVRGRIGALSGTWDEVA